MIITNKTTGETVSDSAREARSFLSRLRGLMFAKKPQTLVLVSPGISVEGASIHMLFMRQAIDVIWLDDEFKTADFFENAKPWALKVFHPKAPAKYVVECPVGTIERTKTKIGDVFSFEKAKSV